MARALSSVPEAGAPTDRLLPLRSASDLMPDSWRGDDLDVVGIDGGDAAQFVELAGEAGLGVAFRRELDGIAEREGDLALALLQEVEVLDGSLGGLHLCAGALDAFAIDIGQGNAERIVYARSAAREHVDELLRLGRHGGEAEREGGGGNKTGGGPQHVVPPWIVALEARV